jgi:predicted aconitase
LYLTRDQEKMANGELGEAQAEAMKLLTAIGDVFEAERMIPVQSAQVSGVSYKTIGEPGLEYLRDLARKGARVKVLTTTNPAGMDLGRWKKLQIPEQFAKKQLEIIRAYRRMGVVDTCTCIPFFAMNRPRRGQHIAWAESSAVVFANSILGAKTNREGGPIALASGITGLTPLYGLHLDENRQPTHLVDIKAGLTDELDYSLLGYVVGNKLGYSIPLFPSILKKAGLNDLKALCAGLASSGSIALFHISESLGSKYFHERGITERLTVEQADLQRAREMLSTSSDFEAICVGCPHCTLMELEGIARSLKGIGLKKKLLCYTNRSVYAKAREKGYIQAIERAGGDVIVDTCMVVTPIESIGANEIATNSCKAAHYFRSLSKTRVTLMTLNEILRMAS